MNPKPLNTLLDGDDINDCQFFKDTLEALPQSTNPVTVPNGDELMDYLAQNMGQLPHMHSIDINMPRKNGFGCLADIKKNELLKNLPVIKYSTSYSKDKINVLFNTGANVYVRKPANFAQLVPVIHHAIPMVAKNIFSER